MDMTSRGNGAVVGRRRVLTLIASAGVIAASPTAASGIFGGSDIPVFRWRDRALGASASLLFHGLAHQDARRLARAAMAEVTRLERVFSLYRADSALVRLNVAGSLSAPPPELVTVLHRALRWSAVTDGAFDPTVQPLWDVYRQHFAAPSANPAGPDPARLEAARALVDWQRVEVSPERITFAQPGMAVTLNGIAQGAITDSVVRLLKRSGVRHVLVDMGELRAIDGRHDGKPWRVGLANPFPLATEPGVLDVVDRAVATSSTSGTVFAPAAGMHHILRPSTGRPGEGLAQASVQARRAIDADALSTALVAAGRWRIPPEAPQMGIERVVAIDTAGRREDWQA